MVHGQPVLMVSYLAVYKRIEYEEEMLIFDDVIKYSRIVLKNRPR